MMKVMRCDSGKHELTLLKARCPFCENERLRLALQAIVDIYKVQTSIWVEREITVGNIARSAINGTDRT